MERITIFKDRVVVKVCEFPVEEIQKVLNKKLVFGGHGPPERWGTKTNFQAKNGHRNTVVELVVNWRGQRGPKTNFSDSSFIGKTRFMPAFELSLDLFRIIGYEGERFLSMVPECL